MEDKQKKMAKSDFEETVYNVSTVSIIGNILLSIFKLLTGFIAHSSAMISDAVHSASDVFSTIVVIIGVKLASKKSDKEHPYGHERLECIAAIVSIIIKELMYWYTRFGCIIFCWCFNRRRRIFKSETYNGTC